MRIGARRGLERKRRPGRAGAAFVSPLRYGAGPRHGSTFVLKPTWQAVVVVQRTAVAAPLLVTQSLHGVDLRRAARRHPASESSNREHRGAHEGEHLNVQGLTPKRRVRANRVRPAAMPSPTTAPKPTNNMPRPTTIRITWPASAPSAIRTPTSRVRCATRNDITPYRPTVARTELRRICSSKALNE